MKPETVKIEPNVLALEVIDPLAECARLEQVKEKFGAETVSLLVAELNASLPENWRRDLSHDADTVARPLAGGHLARFQERLQLELGVRHMELVDSTNLTPSDRPLEQLIAERLAIIEAESAQAPEQTPSEGVEAWLRLPSPSVSYDLDAGLGKPADKLYQALCDELCQATLAAIRACTKTGGWIYVVHEPEGFSQSFRVWPHGADERVIEHIYPVPDGDDEVLLARDFSWGLYATWSFDQSVDWALSIYGRPLLDAFAKLQPRALDYPIRIDGRPV